jgi:hypothetical protein
MRGPNPSSACAVNSRVQSAQRASRSHSSVKLAVACTILAAHVTSEMWTPCYQATPNETLVSRPPPARIIYRCSDYLPFDNEIQYNFIILY